jgi:hypothetical protein
MKSKLLVVSFAFIVLFGCKLGGAAIPVDPADGGAAGFNLAFDKYVECKIRILDKGSDNRECADFIRKFPGAANYAMYMGVVGNAPTPSFLMYLITRGLVSNPKVVLPLILDLVRDPTTNINMTDRAGRGLLDYVADARREGYIKSEILNRVDSAIRARMTSPDAATKLLFNAVIDNDLHGVRRALARGARVDDEDHQGDTPLHIAVRLLEGLLQREIQGMRFRPNFLETKERLEWKAQRESIENIIRLILFKGPDILKYNNVGQSPMTMAMTRFEIFRLLSEAPAARAKILKKAGVLERAR